ncbi:MAG TPA: hypothetical protein VKU01_17310 [Bryobacteraceae bacterium]|nr:hypothetical protein [Bryobacteraceae bacterium]
MNCSAVDLKAYALGEAPADPTVTSHVHSCQACSEELERLQATHTALLSLPEEEPPHRIAFVSDKVFEPHWWQRIWHSGPAMGFASAVVLAGAILLHGSMRPAVVAAGAVDSAQIEARIRTEVNKAVADSESRQAKETARLLDASQKRYEADRQTDLVSMREAMAYYQKQINRWVVASNYSTERPGGAR